MHWHDRRASATEWIVRSDPWLTSTAPDQSPGLTGVCTAYHLALVRLWFFLIYLRAAHCSTGGVRLRCGSVDLLTRRHRHAWYGVSAVAAVYEIHGGSAAYRQPMPDIPRVLTDPPAPPRRPRSDLREGPPNLSFGTSTRRGKGVRLGGAYVVFCGRRPPSAHDTRDRTGRSRRGLVPSFRCTAVFFTQR